MTLTIDDIRKLLKEENQKLENSMTEKLSAKLSDEIADLKKTLDEQTATFNKRLTSTEKDLNEIKTSLDYIYTDNEKNIRNIADLTNQVDQLKMDNTELKDQIDDQINRNMRCNLVFYNVPETEGKEFDSTKLLLEKIIEENLKEKTFDGAIVRAHRGKSSNFQKGRPRAIICKLNRDDTADEIEYKFANLGMQRINNVRCSKQFSPDVQRRRNEALLERKTLKEAKSIEKAYIKYPATLMVKKPNTAGYVKHKSF